LGEPQLDWAALIDREKQLIRPIPQSIARTLAEHGVEIIRGHAAFVAPNAYAYRCRGKNPRRHHYSRHRDPAGSEQGCENYNTPG
jgi:pyruvate/2-oxoglutarate dehydrogenase complex dihydrolipoamide dehydrogenase (E3) component